jgi:hypothetical protein
MFQVVNRSFQIMQKRMEDGWRRMSDIVIEPEVEDVQWDEFVSARKLVEAGERAAEKVLPEIISWIESEKSLRLPVNGNGLSEAAADSVAHNGNGLEYHQSDWSLKKS